MVIIRDTVETTEEVTKTMEVSEAMGVTIKTRDLAEEEEDITTIDEDTVDMAKVLDLEEASEGMGTDTLTRVKDSTTLKTIIKKVPTLIELETFWGMKGSSRPLLMPL